MTAATTTGGRTAPSHRGGDDLCRSARQPAPRKTAAGASGRLWLLDLPVLVQSLPALLVGWSDTALTGQLLAEEKYLAAITAVTYLHWLIDGVGGLIVRGLPPSSALLTAAGPTSLSNPRDHRP